MYNECISRGCLICNNQHHTLLHSQNLNQTTNNSSSENPKNTNYSARHTSGHSGQRSNYAATNRNINTYGNNNNRAQSYLHASQTSLNTSNPPPQNTTTSQSLSALRTESSPVLLSTVEFYCYKLKGIKVSAKAVLDHGIQHSFVTNN